MSERIFTGERSWRYSGIEWNRRARCRFWLFAGKRDCHEFEVIIEDCDGDFAVWAVTFGGQTLHSEQVEDEAVAEKAALSYLEATAQRLLQEVAR